MRTGLSIGGNVVRAVPAASTVATVTAAIPWTPADAPAGTIAAWWNPSDPASRTSSNDSRIDTLTDKSGNGHTLTGSGSTRPNFNKDYFAGDSMGFDKVDDVLVSINSITLPQPFVVYQDMVPGIAAGGNQTAWDANNSAFFRPTQGGNPLVFAGSVDVTRAGLANGVQQITRCRYTGGQGYLSINGGVESQKASGANSGTGLFRLGNSPSGDAPYSGHLRETVVINGDVVFDSTLDKQIRGYLAWESGNWARQPAGFDFKIKRPYVGVTPTTPNVPWQTTAYIPHGTSATDFHYANIFDPRMVDHPTDPTKYYMITSGQGIDDGLSGHPTPGNGIASIGLWVGNKATPTATPTFVGVILTAGPGWDAANLGVRNGSIIGPIAGVYYLYYCTQKSGGGNNIGVATSTTCLPGSWTKQSTALIDISGDETGIGEPQIWYEDGIASITYTYRTASEILPGIRFATSGSLTGGFVKGTVNGEKDIAHRPAPGLYMEAHQRIKRNGRYYFIQEMGGSVANATPYRGILLGCPTPIGRYVFEKYVMFEDPSAPQADGNDANGGEKYHVATFGLYTFGGTDYLYRTSASNKAQPYGENHWNMFGSIVTGLFDLAP